MLSGRAYGRSYNSGNRSVATAPPPSRLPSPPRRHATAPPRARTASPSPLLRSRRRRARQRIETLEHALVRVIRDAGALVLDVGSRACRSSRRAGEHDLPARRRKRDRVVQQVRQRLPQQERHRPARRPRIVRRPPTDRRRRPQRASVSTPSAASCEQRGQRPPLPASRMRCRCSTAASASSLSIISARRCAWVPDVASEALRGRLRAAAPAAAPPRRGSPPAGSSSRGSAPARTARRRLAFQLASRMSSQRAAQVAESRRGAAAAARPARPRVTACA